MKKTLVTLLIIGFGFNALASEESALPEISYSFVDHFSSYGYNLTPSTKECLIAHKNALDNALSQFDKNILAALKTKIRVRIYPVHPIFFDDEKFREKTIQFFAVGNELRFAIKKDTADSTCPEVLGKDEIFKLVNPEINKIIMLSDMETNLDLYKGSK